MNKKLLAIAIVTSLVSVCHGGGKRLGDSKQIRRDLPTPTPTQTPR